VNREEALALNNRTKSSNRQEQLPTSWPALFSRSMARVSCFVRFSGRVMSIPFYCTAQRTGGESGRGSPSRSHFFRYWVMHTTFWHTLE
jgi:hypothetical protein